MTARNVYFWFDAARRPKYAGPKQGALLLPDGSLVAVDFEGGDQHKIRANRSLKPT